MPNIKPRSPRLNGKVELSHVTDEVEFYQLLKYTDDMDVNEKLATWKNYNNLYLSHGGLKGHYPYERIQMRSKC